MDGGPPDFVAEVRKYSGEEVSGNLGRLQARRRLPFSASFVLARRGGGGRVTGTSKHIEEGLALSKSGGRVAPASLSR